MKPTYRYNWTLGCWLPRAATFDELMSWGGVAGFIIEKRRCMGLCVFTDVPRGT